MLPDPIARERGPYGLKAPLNCPKRQALGHEGPILGRETQRTKNSITRTNVIRRAWRGRRSNNSNRKWQDFALRNSWIVSIKLKQQPTVILILSTQKKTIAIGIQYDTRLRELFRLRGSFLNCDYRGHRIMAKIVSNVYLDTRLFETFFNFNSPQFSNVDSDSFTITFSPGNFANITGSYPGGPFTAAEVFINNNNVANVSQLNLTGAQLLNYANMTPQQVIRDIFKGNDTLVGSNSFDYLDGFGGADDLVGKDGSDYYIVDNKNDDVFERVADGDFDVVASKVSYELTASQDIETLIAFDIDAKTALSLTGNRYSNNVCGNEGANRLSGAGGQDVLFGDKGVDSFAFGVTARAANADHIHDFNVGGQDKIVLVDNFFGALEGAKENRDVKIQASEFKIMNGNYDADDHLLYDKAAGKLYYDPTGNGGNDKQLIFILDKNKAQLNWQDIWVDN